MLSITLILVTYHLLTVTIAQQLLNVQDQIDDRQLWKTDYRQNNIEATHLNNQTTQTGTAGNYFERMHV